MDKEKRVWKFFSSFLFWEISKKGESDFFAPFHKLSLWLFNYE
ncbi:hypothetical protein SSIN_0101 [Streptococcus sinensis]|uniref:Uncharacterized protein n=1 Tax=Streptococcus sinensis TaxID=176090 RepID=A0A0A0DJW4_9STRE|nr:hypothetical protein SSIN_0101 [Streptococcus sinensis]